jgi:hypothetical protein
MPGTREREEVFYTVEEEAAEEFNRPCQTVSACDRDDGIPS